MITMAIGESGRAVQTTVPGRTPGPMDIGKHIHAGGPESTVGGPGCTSAPGSSLSGSSGSSPYGGAGDTDHDGH